MTSAAFAYLFTAVVLNTAAQLLLKAGTNALGVLSLGGGQWGSTLARMAVQPHFLAGIAIYMVSLVIWIVGLSRVPVSIAFPLLSLGYVLNAAAAWWLFGETLSMSKWLGIGFIVLGVWLVARG
jgi:multidrug transporter EmrE-like cation transporter